MTTEIIRYAVDTDGIATLTLDYPGKTMNVIDQAFMDSLDGCIERIKSDAQVRGAIITSGKDSFVAGADLMGMEANIDAMADMPIEELFESCASLSKLLRKLETLGKPLVAAINGMALGGGYEICLACHHRIAADAPTAMVGLPEAQVGLLPGAGGTQRLPRAIGKAKAMDMCLSARVLDAQEADRYGLVSRVVPDAELLAHTQALAARIADYSLPALMAIKASVNRAWEGPLTEGILFERQALYARFASADAHEGMHAFLEKRPPSFTHR